MVTMPGLAHVRLSGASLPRATARSGFSLGVASSARPSQPSTGVRSGCAVYQISVARKWL